MRKLMGRHSSLLRALMRTWARASWLCQRPLLDQKTQITWGRTRWTRTQDASERHFDFTATKKESVGSFTGRDRAAGRDWAHLPEEEANKWYQFAVIHGGAPTHTEKKRSQT